MAFKAILLCASALLVQSIWAQCCGTRYIVPSCGCSSGYGYGYGYGYGSNSNNVAISSDGGSLIVTSIGPIVPSGIAVSSDISLNGNLDVCGTLPFLSTVAFNDCLPTSGSGCVNYGCGNGCVGIQNVVGGNSLFGINGCNCLFN